ncbi:hypothetical protein OCA26_28565 [Bacillus cereus]|uniref:hypothetical protein n=1 Tax=Bacillus cereus group TaxID=86661 RepID=UPI000B14FA51|nr:MULTISPECIES: hypothetical protein [Bacillus cereus group]MCU4760021.1 hypothetical protein [Bacillus cereus]MCU5343072.1 hypothetical protein [Bacillus cereus]
MENTRTARKLSEREKKRKRLFSFGTVVTGFGLLRNMHYFFTKSEVGKSITEYVRHLFK